MGIVYRAEQEKLHREVALKLMRAGYAFSPKSRERFRREIDALCQLEHPGICPVLDAGEVDARPTS